MQRNTRDRANAGSRRRGHRCGWGKWKAESGRRIPRTVPSEHVRDQKEQHQQPDRHAEQPGDQVFAHVVGPGGRDAVGAAAVA
ncbi:hypothetical protein LGN07_03720 [Burkholderia cepacia]|uniref:hypothetical protein n=1 Tax=Burkholderia cepacia TaxID=292 RepID=UPI000AC6794B|nr:hypothetical protein [Burkholderia cepacia]MCA8117812.1 hypothetical protein [Burkholderia cepacia]